MSDFEQLLQCCGTWAGRNRVQPFVGDPVDESSSQLTVTPILHGTFVRLDQQWSWKDSPQVGLMLIGYLPGEERATVYWIDTWHNGRRAMNLAGRFEPEQGLVAHGSFAVEGQPDWGWRIEIQARTEELTVNMFCINPANGKEEGWVWSTFARV